MEAKERILQMFGTTIEDIDGAVEAADWTGKRGGLGVKTLAVSILSDAQELMGLAGADHLERARQKINIVKYIIDKHF